ncbi:MAG: adenosine deaminase [Deltaproteobacteria bacterium]|nr:adenosine deaminase [Deltaproteobacteria bacterium]
MSEGSPKPTEIQREFIKGVPKVELHVHLEGSLSPELWVKIAARHQKEEAVLTVDDVKRKFIYRDFMDFVDVFRQIVELLKTPEDFYDLTCDFLEKSAKQNIRYTEVMFTPWFYVRGGIPFHEMMSAIRRAYDEKKDKLGIEMRMIFDGARNFGPVAVYETFELASKDLTGLVIGVGLGGDEKNYPAAWFVKEFDYARSLGLKTIAHAGETDGEESMLKAIKLLKVSRIGHCLGIKESSELEEAILNKNITLDLCPWSNVATGSLGSIQEHPFNSYLQRNYPITLNSDDPQLFQTDLIREYETMSALYDLDLASIALLSTNAVIGSFLDRSDQEKLIKEISHYADGF